MAKENSKTVKETVKTGVSFGSALAMVISYVNWHSIGWAILHGLMGWVYVIYEYTSEKTPSDVVCGG